MEIRAPLLAITITSKCNDGFALLLRF